MPVEKKRNPGRSTGKVQGGKMKLVRRLVLVTLLSGSLIAMYAAKGNSRTNKSSGDEQFLIVIGVVQGGVSAKLGIHEGDILRAYNGNGVQSIKELEAAKNMAVDSVEVIFDREDQTLSFKFPPGPMGVYLEERLPELKLASDTILLHGIAPLREDDGMNNSFILSLTRAANFLKDTLDYTMLMGLSGAAFRIQMGLDWGVGAILASEGYRCDQVALGALGYEYKFIELDKTENNRESMRQAIIQTIEAGSPVLGFQMSDQPDWGVITGYQRGGREFLVRTYASKREGYSLAEAFPKAVYLIEGRNVPPTHNEAIIHSFAVAQAVLDTPKVDNYYCGMTAINNWLQTLETGKFQEINQEEFDNITKANYAMFTHLIEDRSFAASYLERIAPEFPDIQNKLKSIAELYNTEVEYLNVACNEDSCIPLPEVLKSQYDWTPEMRRSEINYLRFARVQEDEALKLWREINAIYNPAPQEGEAVDTTPKPQIPQEETKPPTEPTTPTTPPSEEQPKGGRVLRGAQ
jgi:hypothetical protein